MYTNPKINIKNTKINMVELIKPNNNNNNNNNYCYYYYYYYEFILL